MAYISFVGKISFNYTTDKVASAEILQLVKHPDDDDNTKQQKNEMVGACNKNEGRQSPTGFIRQTYGGKRPHG